MLAPLLTLTALAAPGDAPFAFADFSWMPGNAGSSEKPLSAANGAFVGEFRADVPYHYSFAAPADHTISGSSEVFRHGEVQITQLGVGGDFAYKGAHARVMTQFGMYSQTRAAATRSSTRSASRGRTSRARRSGSASPRARPGPSSPPPRRTAA